jgi:hypothetical protein
MGFVRGLEAVVMGCATCDYACEGCRRCCHELGEWFMLMDHLWRIVAGEGEVLCVGCVEARLGRELKLADFAQVPVNMEEGQSDHLRDRFEQVPPPAADSSTTAAGSICTRASNRAKSARAPVSGLGPSRARSAARASCASSALTWRTCRQKRECQRIAALEKVRRLVAVQQSER